MKPRLAYQLVITIVLLFGMEPSMAQSPGSASQEPSNKDTRNKQRQSTQQPKGGPLSPHHEITVTATRTPTPAREVGQSLTIITAEEIEAQGARDVLQVLETVPGFNVVRTGSFGGTTSVFVRGGESDFNLVLIDGVQVNRPGGAFDLADLTTTNIERIEIVRGPASVLYGSDAVTSVISITTRKGEGRPSGNLQFEGGTYNSYLFRGATQGQLQRLQYSFGAHYSESDGFHDFNSQYNKVDLSASSTVALTPDSFISGSLRYLNSDNNFPTDSTGAVVDPNDFRKTNERLYSLSYNHLFSDRFDTKVHYGYYSRDFTSVTVRDDIVDFFDSEFELTENRNYLDWQNSFQVNPENLITVGTSYEREASQTDDLSRRSVGLYLQDHFSWRDRLFLTAGARYDNNDRFKNFATVSFSMAYLLDDEWKLRASVGNGFRAPSFSEIIGFPDFGIVGNSDLQPEKNVTTDFGVDYVVGIQGSLSATVFFNRFSDLIEFSFLVPPETPNFINVEKAKSQGLELNGFVSATERLRFGGQYTFTDTEVTDAGTVPGGSFTEGEQLLRRPRNTAGVYGEFLKGRYKFRIDFKFKGKRDDVQFFSDFSSARVVLPSYLKTDFSVTVPILRFSDSFGDLALVFRGENIFDKEYTEIAGFESIGRSFFGGLDVAF